MTKKKVTQKTKPTEEPVVETVVETQSLPQEEAPAESKQEITPEVIIKTQRSLVPNILPIDHFEIVSRMSGGKGFIELFSTSMTLSSDSVALLEEIRKSVLFGTKINQAACLESLGRMQLLIDLMCENLGSNSLEARVVHVNKVAELIKKSKEAKEKVETGAEEKEAK